MKIQKVQDFGAAAGVRGYGVTRLRGHPVKSRPEEGLYSSHTIDNFEFEQSFKYTRNWKNIVIDK